MAFCAVHLPDELATLLILAIPIVQGIAEGVAMHFTGTLGHRRRREWTFFAVNVPYWLLIAGGVYSLQFSALASPWSLLLAGSLLGFAGIGLRTYCHFLLGPRFSPYVELQADHQLVATGPYRWVRHPMYLGTVMILVGLILIVPTWWSVAMSSLAMLGLFARIHREEQMLLAGVVGYSDYQRGTWRLVPGLW